MEGPVRLDHPGLCVGSLLGGVHEIVDRGSERCAVLDIVAQIADDQIVPSGDALVSLRQDGDASDA